MKKLLFVSSCRGYYHSVKTALTMGLAALIMVVGMAGVSMAEVNVSIGIDIPVLRFSSPPDVVVVPSGDAYVYMVPDTPGLYFYGGYWYRVYDDRWYRARAYNGRWTYIDYSMVPAVIIDVPPDYSLYLPPDYMRLKYSRFNRGWRSWDRDRHWHRYDWYRHERRDDIRRGRLDHLERERGTRRLHRDDVRRDDRRRDDRRRDDVRRDDRRRDDRKRDDIRRDDRKRDDRKREERIREKREEPFKKLNEQIHRGPQG